MKIQPGTQIRLNEKPAVILSGLVQARAPALSMPTIGHGMTAFVDDCGGAVQGGLREGDSNGLLHSLALSLTALTALGALRALMARRA